MNSNIGIKEPQPPELLLQGKSHTYCLQTCSVTPVAASRIGPVTAFGGGACAQARVSVQAPKVCLTGYQGRYSANSSGGAEASSAAPIGPLALARQRASAVRGFTGARTPVCEHPHGPTRVLAAPTRGVALTLSANIRCAGGFGAPRIFNTSLLKHAERPSTNGLSFAEGLPSATIYIRDISMPSGSLNTVVPSYARPQSRECSDIHRITALL